MPEGGASMAGGSHELYTQALAARMQSEHLAGKLRATRQQARENWQAIREAWDRAEQVCADRLAVCSYPDGLRHSAYARLRARLASMPVIEQAKGILMAQYGWPEDQAFDALRRASQRDNIKVRDLAVSIVAKATRRAPAQRRPAGAAPAAARLGGDVTPRASSGGSQDRYRPSA
jgi:hypothetical protein